jgi:hypothetical protein
MRAAAKRQRTMTPAADSISESAPKPTRAIEDAARPARIAIAASTTCHPRPSQASARARRTRAERSSAAGGAAVWRGSSTAIPRE